MQPSLCGRGSRVGESSVELITRELPASEVMEATAHTETLIYEDYLPSFWCLESLSHVPQSALYLHEARTTSHHIQAKTHVPSTFIMAGTICSPFSTHVHMYQVHLSWLERSVRPSPPMYMYQVHLSWLERSVRPSPPMYMYQVHLSWLERSVRPSPPMYMYQVHLSWLAHPSPPMYRTHVCLIMAGTLYFLSG